MQMKTQLNQMMMSLKQKDEIINQQNLKLSQIDRSNPQMGMNNFMGSPQIGNMFPNPQINAYGNLAQMNQNFLGNK
jgi:hypothetical protein